MTDRATSQHPRVTCVSCGTVSRLIPKALPVCVTCLRNRSERGRDLIREAHATSRQVFGLPEKPPDAEDGIRCRICANQCRIPKGERGFCGLHANVGGKIRHLGGTRRTGRVSWYYDPLPTNCVADWVCPGGSDSGYPRFSFAPKAEYGYENLAVFYEACTFNCLFCQNWHFRQRSHTGRPIPAADLADAVRPTTACICYFGGDPTPQLSHALAASRLAVGKVGDRILRICWETNGSMQRALLREMATLSLDTGGCIKFDLKAFDENLHTALCGVGNRQTLENFAWLAEFTRRRPDPPPVVASTLLVPGYIDAEEVKKIAGFIASLDKGIPYALLAFHPCFFMPDLPRTSRRHAEQALQAAQGEGLARVRLGNIHLLSDAY